MCLSAVRAVSDFLVFFAFLAGAFFAAVDFFATGFFFAGGLVMRTGAFLATRFGVSVFVGERSVAVLGAMHLCYRTCVAISRHYCKNLHSIIVEL